MFPPHDSLVLTPDKMLQFYRQFRQPRETVDMERLFTASNRFLESLYLDLQCEYHLVQDAPGTSRPRRAASVPALTPQGFAQWSAVLVGAFPGLEARRLQDAVASLPLEAVPHQRGRGPRERLPRRIPRHLFPDQADPSTLRLVLWALSGFADSPAPRRSGASRQHSRPQTRRDGSASDAVIAVQEDGGKWRSYYPCQGGAGHYQYVEKARGRE
ncbi:hypothetical protein PWT90_08718 [Aphanocladium album]|nr:hypothetical protein PWT90_08718 [Aphanocladium album]